MQQPFSEAVPAHLISRKEAAHRLNVPLSSFRRNIEGKQLQPRVINGEYHFIVTEVEALMSAQVTSTTGLSPRPPSGLSGELFSQAFAILDQGGHTKNLVIQLKIDPDTAKFLYQEWLSLPDHPSDDRVKEILNELTATSMAETLSEQLEEILEQFNWLRRMVWWNSCWECQLEDLFQGSRGVTSPPSYVVVSGRQMATLRAAGIPTCTWREVDRQARGGVDYPHPDPTDRVTSDETELFDPAEIDWLFQQAEDPEE